MNRLIIVLLVVLMALVTFKPVAQAQGYTVTDLGAISGAYDCIPTGINDDGWVVDALFGSGLQGPVRPPHDRVIETINASGARVFAVDIPSGLDSDTGRPMGPTVRAHHTATVAALKKGFLEPAARAWLGQVHVIDMGAPRRLLAESPSPHDALTSDNPRKH